MHVFFFPISIFLSFRRGRNGKKKGSFRSSFQLFLLFREGVEDGEKNEESSFFLFFHSFCFFSSLFRGRIEENGARRNPFLFLLPFLFLKRNRDKNGNEKAFFFPLFLLFFLLFPPSSFQFFLLFGEGEKDKGNCPKSAKKILQEHSQRRFPGCRAVKVPILRSCGNDLATKFHYS